MIADLYLFVESLPAVRCRHGQCWLLWCRGPTSTARPSLRLLGRSSDLCSASRWRSASVCQRRRWTLILRWSGGRCRRRPGLLRVSGARLQLPPGRDLLERVGVSRPDDTTSSSQRQTKQLGGRPRRRHRQRSQLLLTVYFVQLLISNLAVLFIRSRVHVDNWFSVFHNFYFRNKLFLYMLYVFPDFLFTRMLRIWQDYCGHFAFNN